MLHKRHTYVHQDPDIDLDTDTDCKRYMSDLRGFTQRRTHVDTCRVNSYSVPDTILGGCVKAPRRMHLMSSTVTHNNAPAWIVYENVRFFAFMCSVPAHGCNST
jgi:hypothetical protein